MPTTLPQAADITSAPDWYDVCGVAELMPNSGVCALVDNFQVALFYLPTEKNGVFALANHDPIGKANVLSRGIVGSIAGEPVVASPLYKQHFSLLDGHCLEQQDISAACYPVCIDKGRVLIDRRALS